MAHLNGQNEPTTTWVSNEGSGCAAHTLAGAEPRVGRCKQPLFLRLAHGLRLRRCPMRSLSGDGQPGHRERTHARQKVSSLRRRQLRRWVRKGETLDGIVDRL